MNLEPVPRDTIGKDNWNRFIGECDEAWLWHCFDIPDAVSSWEGYQDLSFGIQDSDHKNDLVAILPLFRHRDISMTSMGGPALKNLLGKKQKSMIYGCVYDQLHSLAKRNAIGTVYLTLPALAPAYTGDNCPLVNPLLYLRCENALTQTWMVEIRSDAELLWKNMEARARTAVRKAEKSGVTVRRAQPDELDIYYHLHCETYNRTGVIPHPKAYFKKIWESCLLDGRCFVLFAECRGSVVAAENFGVFKGRAIYWTGAANDLGLKLGANSLIQWRALQWMADNNIQWYETGEAFPNLREGKRKGLSDFKQSFGGTLFPFYKGILRMPREEYQTMLVKRLFVSWLKSTKDLLTPIIGEKTVSGLEKIMRWTFRKRLPAQEFSRTPSIR